MQKDTYGEFAFVFPTNIKGYPAFKMFPWDAELSAAHAEIKRNIPHIKCGDNKIPPHLENAYEEIKKALDDALADTRKILEQDNVVYVDFKKKKKVN